MIMFAFSLQCQSYLRKKHILPSPFHLATPPSTLGSRLGVLTPPATGSMTSGLVGEMQHQVLPAVPPWVTLGLTLAAILVRTLCLDAINDTTVCARMCVRVYARMCVCVCVRY